MSKHHRHHKGSKTDAPEEVVDEALVVEQADVSLAPVPFVQSEVDVVEPTPLLCESELEDFISYVRGENETPPACVTRVMANFTNKLTMLLGTNVVESLGRERRLQDFIEVGEQVVYNRESVHDMDIDELKDRLDSARKTLAGCQEFRRKFVAQNKEVLAMGGTPQEALLQKIMTLNPEQLGTLQSALEGILSAQPIESIEETSPESVEGDLL